MSDASINRKSEGTRVIESHGKAGRKGPRSSLFLHPSVVTGLLLVCFLFWFGIRAARLEFADMPHFYIKTGYVAGALMLLSMLAVYRRQLAPRLLARFDTHHAMQVHVLASFLAFALTFVHCRGKFDSVLGIAMMAIFVLVMVSGTLGMAIQRYLYRAMALILPKGNSATSGEVGFERIESELDSIRTEGERLMRNYSLLIESDIVDWTGFCIKLQKDAEADPKSICGLIWNGMTGSAKDTIRRGTVFGQFSQEDKNKVAAELDSVLQKINFRPGMIDEDLKSTVSGRLKEQTSSTSIESVTELMKRSTGGTSTSIKIRKESVRRYVLEALFPNHIAHSERPSETVENFFKYEVGDYLDSPLPPLNYILQWRSSEPVSWTHYQQIRSNTAPEQIGLLDRIWDLVMRRRRLDLEFIIHRVAHIWRPIHFVGAWSLVIVVLAHMWAAIWYDGLWIPFLVPLK